MSIDKAVNTIKKYNNFLITVHVNPEGDALGSELGFYNLIKKLGKRGTMLNDDSIPYGFDFLQQTKLIKRFKNNYPKLNFDCFVVLDCADLKRTGGVCGLNENKKPVLNIDHHISNRGFGDANWVDPSASSCSEMIYRLYKKFKVGLDRDTALAIYTGIMTDTGSFHYSNTSSFTFKAASELIQSGIDVSNVYRLVNENIPLADMKLLLKVLPKMKIYAQGKIAVFEFEKKFFNGKKASVDLGDMILTFGRLIKGVEVVLLFKENPGQNNNVRVNLRSQGGLDVNKIASFFGGGGHTRAAGCNLAGNIKDVSNKVISKIIQSLK